MQGEYYFKSVQGLPDQVYITTFKTQVSSCILDIISCAQPQLDGEKVRQNLIHATYVSGPPGSGKTTMLLETAEKGDLVICLSGECKKQIQARSRYIETIQSVEAANIHHEPFVNLFIDEANMLQVEQVAHLIL